ncbi:putative aldouronate transport system substrate-binding protein [Paenibacillus sp. UNC496MF]|uniref:extracellular solute-binding protein n=1 Tax=Paenibacillus sp. UNC496MF TaxID=1502753 RepID=UPI0008E6DEDD|nr:extracellular solute-binding protein [Paenibacillus sp. UNC496MF]SFJ55231.1 putative aldouronate transport system substrate-binding protein [Paenibacillus sp. UNC496MF]
MKSVGQKWLLPLLAFVLLAAGCGKEAGDDAASNSNASGTTALDNATSGATEDKVTEITVMSPYYQPEPFADDNVIKREYEKRTNMKMDVTLISSNNYEEKANVTLASGDIPDLMVLTDPFTPNVLTMMEQGAFWDITPYIKDYPNLAAYPADIWNNTKVKGKNYMIPRVRALDGDSFPIIRQDWLDKLGLPVPQTLDDLYNVMEAFTEKDPDGDGQKDTYGFTGSVDSDAMGNFVIFQNLFNNANGKWKLDGDKLEDTDLLPGTRDMLVYLNKAFTEGLIPKDFALMKTSQHEDQLKSNRAGIFNNTLNNINNIGVDLVKVAPDAQLMSPLYMISPNGAKMSIKGTGMAGALVIPKKTVSEQKLKAILAMLDYGGSPDGLMLKKGLLGVHIKEAECGYVDLPQKQLDNFGDIGQIFNGYDKYGRVPAAGAFVSCQQYADMQKLIDDRAQYSIGSPAVGLQSPTYNEVGPEYMKKIQDLKIQVIMGKQPIESWDKYVSELKADTKYQQISKEINEAYQDRFAK